jgi:hypothetical protein
MAVQERQTQVVAAVAVTTMVIQLALVALVL